MQYGHCVILYNVTGGIKNHYPILFMQNICLDIVIFSIVISPPLSFCTRASPSFPSAGHVTEGAGSQVYI